MLANPEQGMRHARTISAEELPGDGLIGKYTVFFFFLIRKYRPGITHARNS